MEMRASFQIGALLLAAALGRGGCAVVRPGEVGVKQRLGKLVGEPRGQGVAAFNPFTARIIRLPVRTVNMEIEADLPSKEGLTIGAAVSILYRIEPSSVKTMIEEVGVDYEWRRIEALRELAGAPNAQLVITNGA